VPYSDLPPSGQHAFADFAHPEPVPGLHSAAASCRCAPSSRLYAAISLDLNRLVTDGVPPYSSLTPYVFKVGWTGCHCAHRSYTLNNDRLPERDRAGVITKDGSPKYAGVEDWRFLRCWPVDRRHYDRTPFAAWFRRQRFEGVAQSPTLTTPTDLQRKGEHDWTELYVMREAFVVGEAVARGLVPAHPNDPLGPELLSTVADAVAAVVNLYLRDLGRRR
jgi:hypothetical protein